MKRGLKIFGGIVLALAVAAAVFLVQSGWIRPREANLEAVLAENERGGDAPDAPVSLGMQQQWVVNTVRDATGRELVVEGNFAAWLLPVPGVVMGRASLSNAQGFGDAPFATMDGFEMRFGSISPFDMEMEIERVALAGLRLDLERNAEGQSNWSDFGDDAEPAGGAPPVQTAAPDAGEDDWRVAIDRFEIIDAEVTVQDAFAGQDWKLGGVEFLASGMRPGEPVPLSLSFKYESGEAAVSIESDASTTITAQRWLLEDLSIASSGTGSGWTGLLADASLSVRSVDTDLAQSRAVYEGIELTLDRLAPENLAIALDQLGISIDPDLLARASSSASIRLSGQGTVDQLARSLDLRADMQLADGSLVPLTITGSVDAPQVAVDASR